MFNVSKKTLSVVLCLALLASVVAVCFIPANAETVTASKIVYNDLSLKPQVNLTFDGEARYGIPMGRYTNSISYDADNGYAKAKMTTNWFFLGKDGNVGQTPVDGTKAEDKAAVLADLYKVTAGDIYYVSFKYKLLAGTKTLGKDANDKYIPYTFSVGVSVDPTTNPTKDENWTNITLNGNAINSSEIQPEGETLTADTDWRVVNWSFTANKDGYIGIQGGSKNENGYFALDDVKISKVLHDSSFQDKIDFDGAPRGIGAIRYAGDAAYGAEENGNRYGIINLTGENGSIYLASNEYTTNYKITGAIYTDPAKRTEIAAAYGNLYKFLPGKKYEITFKYKYPENQQTGFAEKALRFKLMADPLGKAHGNFDDLTSSTSWAKDVKIEGNTLGTPDVWQDCKVTFTVKTLEEAQATAGYTKVRNDVDGGYDFDGAYFGFVGTKFVLHVDDYNVKEIACTLESDYVSHDMEKDTINTSTNAEANGSILAEGNVGATIVDSKDPKHGNVLNLGSNAKRFAPADAGVITEGRKCYISFDARATAASTTKFTWFSIGLTQYTNVSIASQNNDRIVLHDPKQSGARKAFEFYVDGVETTYDNFIKLSTEWKHYGIIVDLTNADTLALFKTVNSSWVNNTGKAVYIGAANSQYDNYTIISSSDVAGAVPETDGGDIAYVSKTYENGMDSLDTITNYPGTTTSTVSVDDRGNVVKVTGGLRFCVNDTNFISKGHKYTISFDARLDVEDDTTEGIFMILSKITNSGEKPRFFINNPNANSGAGGSSNDTLVNAAFKFYEQNLTTKEITEISSPRDLKINKTWKKYIIEFDYTNETFISTINAATSGDYYDKNNGSKLTECDSYFHIGNINGMFDNLKIVEETPGVGTEVSIRKAQTFEDKYASAGLRFKATMSTNAAKAASEIGFVVAPSSAAMSTENWYKLEDGVNSIARKGVVKSGSSNFIYNYDEVVAGSEITEYQVVITGLSSQDGKTAYNRRYSAVLYTKDAEDNYSYYALGEASYYQGLGISEVLKAPKIKEAE